MVQALLPLKASPDVLAWADGHVGSAVNGQHKVAHDTSISFPSTFLSFRPFQDVGHRNQGTMNPPWTSPTAEEFTEQVCLMGQVQSSGEEIYPTLEWLGLK